MQNKAWLIGWVVLFIVFAFVVAGCTTTGESQYCKRIADPQMERLLCST